MDIQMNLTYVQQEKPNSYRSSRQSNRTFTPVNNKI